MFESLSGGLNRLRAVSLFACCVIAGCGQTTGQLPVATLAEAETPEAETETPVAVTQVPAETQAPTEKNAPQPKTHTVRKTVAPIELPAIPEVFLSTAHAKLCNLNVGESFPATMLPRLSGKSTDLETLRGRQATVILFWQPDRWMAHMALADLQREVAGQFDAQQVGLVGIAVQQPQGSVQAALNKAKASFPQLLDSQGKTFATVGSHALPRVYVLDATGKVVWFDIEYSESTRRELGRTLGVLTTQSE